MSNYSLTAEQKRIKKFQVRRGWMQFVKVAFRIVALVVCVIVFAHIQKGPLSRLAAIGDFRPVTNVYAVCTTGAKAAFDKDTILSACNNGTVLTQLTSRNLTNTKPITFELSTARLNAHVACSDPKGVHLNAGGAKPQTTGTSASSDQVENCVNAINKYNKLLTTPVKTQKSRSLSPITAAPAALSIQCCLKSATQASSASVFNYTIKEKGKQIYRINNRNNSFSIVDPTPEQLASDYINVEDIIRITFIVYMALNCVLIMLHCLDFQFKGKRGVLLKLQTVERCLPLLTAAFLTWFLVLRLRFTSGVVFCTFKNDYFALRHIWEAEGTGYRLTLQEDDYICDTFLAQWFTAMIIIEVFITGLNFAVVVVSYYKNVLDIKPKGDGVKYE